MPFVGVQVKDDYPKRHRSALLLALENCEELSKILLDATKGKDFDYILRRKPYTGDYSLLIYTEDGDWIPIAKFGMLPMPGCSAVCILHHAEVEVGLRKRGIGRKLLEIRLQVAKELGYSAVLCTVRADNSTEQHLLANNGVMRVASYAKPDRIVQLFWKAL